MPKKIKKSSTKHLASQILEYNNLSTDVEGKNRKHYREVVNETIEEFLSREDQVEYYDALFNSFIENGIRYPDILHFYIRLFLGIYIPRKNFCRDHKAPFTFICDMFFEEVRNSIAFANRIGGKTTNMAILNHLDMAFKPGCEIASAGAIKEQAQKCYTYFVGFHNRNDYLAELIMPHKPPTMKKTFYANGGFLEVITGTIAGFNSPHPHKVRIDEVELMAWDVLQEGLSMVMTTESHATRKDIMAQNVLSCITGGTLIDVPRDKRNDPDGVPLMELKKQFDNGGELFAYCFSHRANRFTLKKIKNIWKTKTDKVYKLTYKDGNKEYSLKATEDHLILLKNGEYKQINELKKNDSLMCFNRKLKGNYHYIDLSEKGEHSKYVPEYYYVYGKTSGIWPSKREHIHHKDFDSYNDLPDNLQKLIINDHMEIHANCPSTKKQLKENGRILGQWVKDFWKNGNPKEQEKRRKILSENGKQLWIDDYEKMCLASQKGHTEEARIKRSNSLKGLLAGDKNPMFGVSYEDHPKGFLNGKHTKKAIGKIRAATIENNLLRGETKLNSLIEKFDVVSMYQDQVLSVSKITNITGYTDTIIKRALQFLGIKIRTKSEQSKAQWQFIERDDYLSDRMRKAANIRHHGINNNNHEVVSVEYAGIEDVYDIEVEDHHNFVVAGGIVLHNSTRKSEAGTMQRLLEKATKEKRKVGGYKIYKWCIWEVLEKCDRECKDDEYYGTCGALEVCKGRAKTCEGYFKIDDFIDKVTMLDRDTWEAQWECKRPSRELFVYGKYWNRDKHMIKRPQKKEEKTDKHYVEDPYYIGAIDFGSSPGHPFVYKEYLLDVEKFKKEVEESEYDEMIRSKITFYVSYEYRSGGDTMEAHAEKIKASPNYSPYMPIFADPSAKQSRIDLEELYGVMTLEADNAVVDGIDKVRAHLQFAGNKAHFYMMNDYLDCDEVELVGSDVEFAQYKFKRTQDGKVNQKEPMKMDDHGMDCDRYAVSSAIPYLREEFQPLWEESTGGFWS